MGLRMPKAMSGSRLDSRPTRLGALITPPPPRNISSDAMRTSRRTTLSPERSFPGLAGLILLLLAMGVMVACGSEAATPGDTPPPLTTAVTATAATASPRTEAATSTPPGHSYDGTGKRRRWREYARTMCGSADVESDIETWTTWGEYTDALKQLH